jgi:protein-S-isoprenylcysteine O-methyltransferase Ste14
MYLLQLVVACILFCCLRQTGIADFLGLGRASTETPAETRLTTTGCYGMVRHPLYLYTITFLILNPVMTAQWLLLTVCSTIYFIIGALIEEKRLLVQFGDRYRRYQQDVPFMVPSMGRFRRPPAA